MNEFSSYIKSFSSYINNFKFVPLMFASEPAGANNSLFTGPQFLPPAPGVLKLQQTISKRAFTAQFGAKFFHCRPGDPWMAKMCLLRRLRHALVRRRQEHLANCPFIMLSEPFSSTLGATRQNVDAALTTRCHGRSAYQQRCCAICDPTATSATFQETNRPSVAKKMHGLNPRKSAVNHGIRKNVNT